MWSINILLHKTDYELALLMSLTLLLHFRLMWSNSRICLCLRSVARLILLFGCIAPSLTIFDINIRVLVATRWLNKIIVFFLWFLIVGFISSPLSWGAWRLYSLYRCICRQSGGLTICLAWWSFVQRILFRLLLGYWRWSFWGVIGG